MRLLFFILLLSVQSFGQSFIFPAVMSSPGEAPPAPVTGERVLIYDDFSGTSLNSRWNVRRPDRQTITVSGGVARVQTFTDTLPQRVGYSYSNLTTQTMIYDTSYGLTSIRNYTIETSFRINEIDDTTLGAYVGCYTPFSVDYPFSNFTHVQYSSPDTLRLLAGKDTAFTFPPAGHQQITFTFNTTDQYYIRHRVFEDYTVQTIKNLTTGDSILRYQQYNFTNGAWPYRPNYFWFVFGAMGRSDVSFDYYKVTTTEELNPGWMVVGDSRPTGYNATSADSAYANMLKRNTTDSIQIWAGGGMGINEILLTLPRLKEINASRYILDFGTNDVFNSDYQTKFTSLTDSLTAWGKPYWILYQPNKGDPVSGSSMNKWYNDNFSSHIIDNWTSPGYATQTTGNGYMYDGVHQTLLGMQTTYQIVKAALSAYFPL